MRLRERSYSFIFSRMKSGSTPSADARASVSKGRTSRGVTRMS